ncbi:MAG: serine hydrolase domain-containing protein [Candidatus Limosilactobacillus intestinavium]
MFLALGAIVIFLYSSGRLHLGDKASPRQLKSYMKSHHINGVMLVNDKDGNPIVVQNKVATNKAEEVKADQLFPIASLQKIMTGAAVYQLNQKQQIEWNTPLSKYYPEVPGSKNITMRELMNHTSGLINNARPSSPLKNQKEQINFMLKHMTYDHLHTWDYQDVDYELLAAIISKETSTSYNSYVKNHLAKPLGLKKIKDYSEVKQKEVPQPMSKNISWRKVTLTTSSDFGAGNLFMSPKDYWKFVYNRVLKNPKMINEFSQMTHNQEVAYFGGVYFNGDVIYGDGSIPGYNCCFAADYKTKKMVMLFSNNMNYLRLKEASDHIRRDCMG